MSEITHHLQYNKKLQQLRLSDETETREWENVKRHCSKMEFEYIIEYLAKANGDVTLEKVHEAISYSYQRIIDEYEL